MEPINIVLSTFNSVDDIKLNLDIYRKNFKNKYNIIVSANDYNSISKIEKLNVDSIIQGTKINYDGSHKYARIHSRVYDSIKNGFQEALKFNDTKYSIHNHADALILKEDSIINIITYMEEKGLKASIRGRGFGWYYKHSPIGMIDDHFFFIDNSLLREKKVFQQEAMELLPTRNNIHGVLAMFMLSNVGLNNIYFHSDVNKLISWDELSVNMNGNYMRPMSYDKDLGFLHINEKSFLNKKHSKAILANYLKMNNINKGIYIEYILDTYLHHFNQVVQELKELENMQNKALKKYFFDLDVLGRDFNVKNNLLSKVSYKIIYKNLLDRINDYIYKKLGCVHLKNKIIYKESLYEKSLNEYYSYHFEDLKEQIKYLQTNNIL